MKLLGVLLMLFFSCPSWAQQTTGQVPEPTGSRSAKRVGIMLTGQGDVGLPTTEVAIGYNAADALRISAEYGANNANALPSSTNTPYTPANSYTQSFLGGRLQAFVPGWHLSPTAGIAYTHAFQNNSIPSAEWYDVNVGLDWQMNFGLTLAGGFKKMIISSNDTIGYLAGGWFF